MSEIGEAVFTTFRHVPQNWKSPLDGYGGRRGKRERGVQIKRRQAGER